MHMTYTFGLRNVAKRLDFPCFTDYFLLHFPLLSQTKYLYHKLFSSFLQYVILCCACGYSCHT